MALDKIKQKGIKGVGTILLTFINGLFQRIR